MTEDRTMNLPRPFHSLLRCPVCKNALGEQGACLECTVCGRSWPVADGTPILINEANSVFRIEEIGCDRSTRVGAKTVGQCLRAAYRLVSISKNWVAERNFKLFRVQLLERSPRPLVLVLGSGTRGEGFDALTLGGLTLVTSDVYLGFDTELVCDAHDIPFEAESLDGIVIQAVLEHVVDPVRCVSEIHRILKPGGLVYAETPFMQQVHMGRYDFTRFTHLGHRRLFRQFAEIDSGVNGGPGMALAWAYQYFLTSFFLVQWARRAAEVFAHLTSFWLKYLDKFLISKPGGFDAASGFYFLGYKTDLLLSDRDLISLYKGAILSD